MWNVPYVSSIYLIKNTAFKHIIYDHQYLDADMAMCESLRNAVNLNVFFLVFYLSIGYLLFIKLTFYLFFFAFIRVSL